MNLKLYELSELYRNLQSYLSEQDIIDEAKFREQLSQITEAFNIKVENVAKIIKESDYEVGVIKQELTRLSSRKNTLEKQIDWLKNYLQTEMQVANTDKIQGEILTVSLQKSPPSVKVIDANLVPQNFRRIIPETFEIDKDKILTAVKATGESIDGVEIINDKKTLRIR